MCTRGRGRPSAPWLTGLSGSSLQAICRRTPLLWRCLHVWPAPLYFRGGPPPPPESLGWSTSDAARVGEHKVHGALCLDRAGHDGGIARAVVPTGYWAFARSRSRLCSTTSSNSMGDVRCSWRQGHDSHRSLVAGLQHRRVDAHRIGTQRISESRAAPSKGPARSVRSATCEMSAPCVRDPDRPQRGSLHQPTQCVAGVAPRQSRGWGRPSAEVKRSRPLTLTSHR